MNKNTNSSNLRRVCVTLTVASLASMLFLSGCAASSGAGSAKASKEEGIKHRVSESDIASTKGATPIASPKIALWINGMGCPQCVTNVDLQLERIKGTKDIRVDLANGKVYATFTESPLPTPDRLSKAIDDAGLTLVKIEPAK